MAIFLGWNRSATDANFAARYWRSKRAAGWQGRLSGQFSKLDSDRFVSQRFPHKLSGRANVPISDARFEASRLTLFDATIVSEGGVVSQSLLQAAIGELQLRRAETFLDGQQRHVAYEQLVKSAPCCTD
ncbi:MAG: hypothetical protein R3C99_04390 [Pirellulaceae bacterium]